MLAGEASTIQPRRTHLWERLGLQRRARRGEGAMERGGLWRRGKREREATEREFSLGDFQSAWLPERKGLSGNFGVAGPGHVDAAVPGLGLVPRCAREPEWVTRAPASILPVPHRAQRKIHVITKIQKHISIPWDVILPP